MSRRKQSRPQHLEHAAKEMPGTDIDTATNKVITAVTSSSPQIKLEPADIIASPTMTQSPECEDEHLRQNTPSKVEAICASAQCRTSPVAQGDDRDKMPTSSSPNLPNSDVVVFKSTKSASCGSLAADFIREEDFANKIRRVSADAVDYTVVKTEPNYDFHHAQSNTSDGNNTATNRAETEANSPPPTQYQEPTRRLSAPAQPQLSNKNTEITEKQSTEGKQNGSPNSAQSERDIAQYQRHLPAMLTPMIAPERKHECERCGVSFRSKKTYAVHVKHYCSGRRHDAECKICGAKFDNEKRLSVHMADHAPQYVCLICSERMSHPDQCTNHMLLHVNTSEDLRLKDGADTIACPGCDLRFGGKMDLTGHLCSHHVTTGNLMPFLFATPPGTFPKQASPNSTSSDGGGQNGGENGGRKSRERNPGPLNNEDVEIHNMSPPLTTSTPTRPATTTTKQTTSGVLQPFACIVCSLGFPDVVELQRHLLTSHASGLSKPASPVPPMARLPPRAANRQNSRKFSTVSPPQLSMLSKPMIRKISEPQRRTPTENCPGSTDRTGRSSSYSPMQNQESHENGDPGIKKRKERGDHGQAPAAQYESGASLKRVKRDAPNHASLLAEKALGNEKYEIRRISCPVMSNEKGIMPAGCYLPLEERYCVQCDITFSNAANFRAHKKYYCASRHMHKTQEESIPDFTPGRHPKSSSPEGHDAMSAAKLRKRNVGNRSSMTSRKRSHLTPLETVRDISPIRDSSKDNTLKVPPMRKSCPSGLPRSPHDDAPDPRMSPGGQNPSPNTPPVLAKKHLCQECSILFSKYDTYVAHKKFYCESRRKDRGGQRLLPTKPPMKRKSESSLRDSISMVDSALFPGDHQRRWSPQRNSPSTDGDEERAEDGESITKEQQNTAFFKNGTIPFGPYAMDQEMLARMSFMQPLIINQYLALLRERMAQGLCGNGFLIPPVPMMNIPGATGASSPAAGLHKRSMSETRAPVLYSERKSSPHVRTPIVSPAPNTSSTTPPVKVKQEPKERDSAPPMESVQPRLRTSPLDLSNKPHCDATDVERRVSQPSFPYPTIDLRTTALAVVKKEPNADFPTSGDSNSHNTVHSTLEREGISPSTVRGDGETRENCNFNNNNADNGLCNTEARHRAVSSPQQESIVTSQQKSRAQHCKNCDARFTSLSTFIAHKKYYCSASSANNLLCSDAKAVQMAR